MSSSYQGGTAGPRDPATPGGYCLTRCYCGECPQYARQHAEAERRREQEQPRSNRPAGS